MALLPETDRAQIDLLPAHIEDYVAPQALVRIVDLFVASLDLAELGFNRSIVAETGRLDYDPGDMLRLYYIWGYLNQVRSSRHLERACVRDLEALWLLRRLSHDYRTIAAFRHDNPKAMASCAAFIQFCRETGLITGRLVALDGTKMRAVASSKNIAGAERLARDMAHTEKEIAYYLDRPRYHR